MRKLFLLLGCEATGTKLFASVLKNVFGLSGQVSDGSVVESDACFIRFSLPSGKNPSQFLGSHGWFDLENGIVNLCRIYNITKDQITIVFTSRYSWCISESLKKQGEDQGYEFIERTAEYRSFFKKEGYNVVELNYEEVTYNTYAYLRHLSEIINVDISLTDEEFRRKCDAIQPQNGKHFIKTNGYTSAQPLS